MNYSVLTVRSVHASPQLGTLPHVLTPVLPPVESPLSGVIPEWGSCVLCKVSTPSPRVNCTVYRTNHCWLCPFVVHYPYLIIERCEEHFGSCFGVGEVYLVTYWI